MIMLISIKDMSAIWRKVYELLVFDGGKFMAGRSVSKFDESTLTKGQRRKLDVLRNSVGDEIGERAFAAWYSKQPKPVEVKVDHDAALIVDTLWPLVREGSLAIPRGGYLLRRGRHRLICEPVRK